MADVTLPGTVQIVDDVPGAFADLVTLELRHSIALSGGPTAEHCYRALRDAPITWPEVDVYYGDERFVPPDHADSNEGMTRRAFLDAVPVRAVHPMYRPVPIDDAAREYDDLVRAAPPIDIVHLGLGPDGHTASLFPGNPALAETERFVVPATDDAHPQARLTFTFPAIARARLVIVTVAGDEKREAVERIRAGEDLPGAHIRADRVVWLGDRAALGEQ
jgi:6-phosphogluconolactonase